MASKKKRLGTYVRERREKHRHPYRLLFHVSTAPRKVLLPHRTTYQDEGDEERQHPLLFLCPLGDVKDWMSWCSDKIPRSRHKDVDRMWFGKGHVVLYVHVIRADPARLVIPRKRFLQEFISLDALRPSAIIPVRYRPGKPVNLARVASRVEQVKEMSRGRSRRSEY
ncbi:MAG: hypothetical protein JW839_23205 [Candidatus Lokiarchaeota archaeon]|nr:hypothetical protein [Candidatus Lokiarchaeota archaeon]